MILSWTGHRPNKLGNDYNYKSSLCQHIMDCMSTVMASRRIMRNNVGGALGVDTMAAIVSIKLQIPFNLYIPFEGQDAIWPTASRKLYNLIRNHRLCTPIIVSPGGYHKDKMQIRNIRMTNEGDVLVAVWNGDKQGGTWNCIEYAISVKKPIVYINI